MLLPRLGDRPPWEQGTWNDAPNERQHEEEEETKGAACWVWVRGVGWLSFLQHGELMGLGCECPGILCRSPSLPIRDFWLISPPCLLRGSVPGGRGEGWGSPGGAGWGLGLCRFSQRSEAAPMSAQMWSLIQRPREQSGAALLQLPLAPAAVERILHQGTIGGSRAAASLGVAQICKEGKILLFIAFILPGTARSRAAALPLEQQLRLGSSLDVFLQMERNQPPGAKKSSKSPVCRTHIESTVSRTWPRPCVPRDCHHQVAQGHGDVTTSTPVSVACGSGDPDTAWSCHRRYPHGSWVAQPPRSRPAGDVGTWRGGAQPCASRWGQGKG